MIKSPELEGITELIFQGYKIHEIETIIEKKIFNYTLGNSRASDSNKLQTHLRAIIKIFNKEGE